MRQGFWERHPRLMASSLAALGLIIGLAGTAGYLADHALSARGVATTALVVRVHAGRTPSYDVRFTLPDHQVVTAQTSYADRGAAVGDAIRIQYDSEDPQTVAEVGARSGAWIFWGGSMLMGAGMVAFAIWRWRRRSTSDENRATCRRQKRAGSV